MRRHLSGLVALALLTGCRTSPAWTALSPDHRTHVQVVGRGERACVTIGGRVDGCWDAVALDALEFSADGRHTAYPARVGTRWAVVRDGIPLREWDGIGAVLFSRDGSRLAYIALANRAWHVVVNDSMGAPFDAIHARSLTFDISGRRHAYAGRRGDSTHVVIDGVVGPGWEGAGSIAFDARGRQAAYVARRGGKAHLVVNGIVGPPHAGIGDVALSPTGKHFAYVALDSGRSAVIEDGMTGPSYAGIRALRYGTAGDQLAYVARVEGGERIVLEDSVHRPYDSVSAPVLSGDGTRWGYIGYEREAAFITIAAEPVRREEGASDLVLGARAPRFAYLARQGDDVVVVDDRGRHSFDLVVAGTLQFLRNGSRWVCLTGDAQRRQLRVVVEGIAGSRPMNWAEVTRLIGRDPSEQTIRAWVAAEGELLMAESR